MPRASATPFPFPLCRTESCARCTVQLPAAVEFQRAFDTAARLRQGPGRRSAACRPGCSQVRLTAFRPFVRNAPTARSPLCSSKRGEPVVYESIGNGVDSKQITPKDDATVKCICGTCDDDGERMVCCDKCQNWLHTRCIGLDDGKEIPPDFSLTQFLRVK